MFKKPLLIVAISPMAAIGGTPHIYVTIKSHDLT